MVMCGWPCPLEAQCFWWARGEGWHRRHLSRSSCLPAPRVCYSLKQGDHARRGSCIWSHHLVKVVITQCPSPGPICFGGLGVTSPASSVPCGGADLCTPGRDAVFLQVCPRPRSGQPQCPPLGLSHQSDPHALDQQTLVGILPAAESVCSSRAFWNWGYDHKTVWGPTVEICEMR